MKTILLRRNGNTGEYAEGNQGTVLQDSYFQVTDELFDDFLDASVESRWTGSEIAPDGTSPDYKDAVGDGRILTDVTESDNVRPVDRPDVAVEFTAADYGYKDDFATDLP